MKWHTVSPWSCCKWNVSQVNNLIELLSTYQIFSLNLPIKTIITQVFANAEESWLYCEGFRVCILEGSRILSPYILLLCWNKNLLGVFVHMPFVSKNAAT